MSRATHVTAVTRPLRARRFVDHHQARRGDTERVPRPSNEWVALSPRFTPGWPWPEESYGLSPMYGDDGWCRGCGTPLVGQAGALVIQGSRFPTAGAWMPNWRFDVVCVSAPVAADLAERFAVDLRDVHKPRTGPTGVKQIYPAQTAEHWHRREDLEAAVLARHGADEGDRVGSECGRCGRWKWLPVSEDEVPIVASAVAATSAYAIASPEAFGDGLKSFRHLLFRRQLGEALVAASPRNWHLVEVQIS